MTVSRYDLCTSRKSQNGAKTYYHKIGSMFPNRQSPGFSIKLDSLPIPNDKGEVWISAFVPRDDDNPRESGQQQRQPSRRQTEQSNSPDDDIPF